MADFFKDNGKELGISSIAGFATGFATKQIGKVFLMIGGIAFMGLQWARHRGYVQIDMDRVNKRVTEICDADGDGKLTVADAQSHVKNMAGYFGAGMPSVAGFSTGFMAGLYYG